MIEIDGQNSSFALGPLGTGTQDFVIKSNGIGTHGCCFCIDYRDLNASLACGLMGLDSTVFSPTRPGGTRTRVPALSCSVQHVA